MKIAIFEVEDWEKQAFEQFQNSHEVVYSDEPLGKQNAGDYSDADIISTFIYSDLGCEVIEQFDRLKLIATRSTGFDHIDLDECKKTDVVVSNVPSYGENTVAEHVFALLLAISHHIIPAVDRTRRGDFSQEGLQGFDLRGKTFGVIGTGDIGAATIEIARGFRMKVLAFDVKPDDELAAKLDFEYVDMDRLLGESDVISLHVPANKHTRGLLSHDEFAKMKNDVVIINTARGSIIDMEALLKAIADGKVRAAGLDVLAAEPVVREEAELLRRAFSREHNLEELLADHILMRLRNVIITPHSGFNTREAVQRIVDTTAGNIAAYLDGNPVNIVNAD
jgi:D-lactate dehydrogenase